MDGYDLLVLEFFALVISVTVLIVISSKFKQLVIITSSYPNLGLTVTVFGHRAPERTYPFICSGIKVRLAELLQEDECWLVSQDDLEV
jgi:hypothetical protein